MELILEVIMECNLGCCGYGIQMDTVLTSLSRLDSGIDSGIDSEIDSGIDFRIDSDIDSGIDSGMQSGT